MHQYQIWQPLEENVDGGGRIDKIGWEQDGSRRAVAHGHRLGTLAEVHGSQILQMCGYIKMTVKKNSKRTYLIPLINGLITVIWVQTVLMTIIQLALKLTGITYFVLVYLLLRAPESWLVRARD